MTTEERMKIISERLTIQLSPQHLNVIDDSAKHIGHVGSEDGAGHYTVEISATAFASLSRLTIHRLIYDALSDLIPKEIHALQIKLI